MRIQLNKTCIEEADYRNFLSDTPLFITRHFSFPHPTTGEGLYEYRNQYNDNFLAFVCPECGAELFAHWVVPDYRINYDSYSVGNIMSTYFDDNNYEGLAHYMEKHPEYFPGGPFSQKRFEEISNIVQMILAAQASAQHEADELFKDMHKCPCCDASLPRTEGFFAVSNDHFGLFHFNADSDTKLIGLYTKDAWDSVDIALKNSELYGSGDFNNCDALFAAMKKFRDAKDQENAGTQLDIVLSQFEIAASTANSPTTPITLKNTEQLKAYLLNLIQTETSILSLTQRLNTLYAQRPDVNRNAYGSTVQALWNAHKQVEDAEDTLRTCQANLAAIEHKEFVPPNLPMPPQPQKPVEPVYEVPGFFNKKRIIAQNEALKKAYEERLIKYENEANQHTQALEARQLEIAKLTQEQIEQHHKDIEFEKACVTEAEIALATAQQKQSSIESSASDFASPEKAYKLLLDAEISQAEELLQKAILCRYQLYNANIIFNKYRNLVALSTFYEYLMSGRCDVLEGASGAYNLYESELRANIIIAQLNNVVESLETIKENQYMIYDAIQTTNTSLRRLESTMNVAAKSLRVIEAKAETMTQYMSRIAANSDVIAHNSAVTAYYSKINAELTNALGFMVALS